MTPCRRAVRPCPHVRLTPHEPPGPDRTCIEPLRQRLTALGVCLLIGLADVPDALPAPFAADHQLYAICIGMPKALPYLFSRLVALTRAATLGHPRRTRLGGLARHAPASLLGLFFIALGVALTADWLVSQTLGDIWEQAPADGGLVGATFMVA